MTQSMQYDTSKDGRIDFDEYCVVRPRAGERGGRQFVTTAALQMIGFKDKDGNITV